MDGIDVDELILWMLQRLLYNDRQCPCLRRTLGAGGQASCEHGSWDDCVREIKKMYKEDLSMRT